ncbi:MAG: hypothetical protein Q9M91_01795 [Candidatus Dojkabacteria bacterium]|nr:hypothetical protein [Candidatus Dojkabacteria bacterium]MDQ7020557.1 hypothetical protein [Candidatus Dojkabacteria bacterium]
MAEPTEEYEPQNFFSREQTETVLSQLYADWDDIPKNEQEIYINNAMLSPDDLVDIADTIDLASKTRQRMVISYEILIIKDGKTQRGDPRHSSTWRQLPKLSPEDEIPRDGNGFQIRKDKNGTVVKWKELIPNNERIDLNTNKFSVDIKDVIKLSYGPNKIALDNSKNPYLIPSSHIHDEGVELHHLIPKNYIQSIRNELESKGFIFGTKPFVDEFIQSTLGVIPCTELARQLATNWDNLAICIPMGNRTHDVFHDTPKAQLTGLKWDNDTGLNSRLLAAHLINLELSMRRGAVPSQDPGYKAGTIRDQLSRVINSFQTEQSQVYFDEIYSRIQNNEIELHEALTLMIGWSIREQVIKALVVGENILSELVDDEFIVRVLDRKLFNTDTVFTELFDGYLDMFPGIRNYKDIDLFFEVMCFNEVGDSVSNYYFNLYRKRLRTHLLRSRKLIEIEF